MGEERHGERGVHEVPRWFRAEWGRFGRGRDAQRRTINAEQPRGSNHEPPPSPPSVVPTCYQECYAVNRVTPRSFNSAPVVVAVFRFRGARYDESPTNNRRKLTVE